MDSIGDDKTISPAPDGRDSGYTLSARDTFGQYLIVRALGRGGMGEVYEAEHTTLDLRYALKLLPPDFASRSGALERFRREAKVMAKLSHPNIIKVSDFGETEGRYWLRMELAQGIRAEGQTVVSLDELAKSHDGKIPQHEFVAILKQILDGLAFAHEHGAIHRDLKPANILLTASGAKVADFGLVKLTGEEWLRNQAELSVRASMSLGDGVTQADEGEGTSTRSLLGTFDYMSPEQKRGEEADERSDVYAVGLVTFRLLTGHREISFKLPSQLEPELVPEWDDFITQSLEPDRNERPESCVVLVKKLTTIEERIAEREIQRREEQERQRQEEQERQRQEEQERQRQETLRKQDEQRQREEAERKAAEKKRQEALKEDQRQREEAERKAAEAKRRRELERQQQEALEQEKKRQREEVAREATEAKRREKEQRQQGQRKRGEEREQASAKKHIAEPRKGHRWLWVSSVLVVSVAVATLFVFHNRRRINSYPSVKQAGKPEEGQDWTAPGIGMELVWIPTMKCWVGKYEVTNGEYCRFKPDHDSGEHGGHTLNDDRQPVVEVSYGDAVAFAEWLTKGEQDAGRFPNGLKLRLPDGDEWMTFAQCGDGREYPWGNDWPPKYGNYLDQSSDSKYGKIDYYDDGFPVSCPVEKSGDNDWGLYGVGGNVREWTSALHADKEQRILYGASWSNYYQDPLRCDFRGYFHPPFRNIIIGFRLLLR
ncbi:MAG: SUMF1/EgtB/PvdO family nonheme iron enzyme [Lentisphaerae bacterium]|nr:SUMF1/EgtB/PvdO family nonheme iron enzyme [Lentisphaerota bacterium]